jgi:hypothetical protein
MIITHELINNGKRSGNGAWTKQQLALIGVQWPPQKGWKQKVIGNKISDADAARFLALKNTTPSQ